MKVHGLLCKCEMCEHAYSAEGLAEALGWPVQRAESEIRRETLRLSSGRPTGHRA